MAKLVWTDEGFEALKAIHAYLLERNPDAANRTLQGIYRRTEDLRNFPNLGYRCGIKQGIERRVILYGHYQILYGIEGDRVAVMGVFHAARDINLSDF